MKILEWLELLYIGFTNIFYNIGLAIYETLRFGSNPWWWKIRWGFFCNYAFNRVRWIITKESARSQYPEDNFIYGETPCITVQQMLETLKYEPGDLFIDLGCGRGLAVFYAHFLGNLKAYGYEIIPSFVRKARKIASSIADENVRFFEEDILNADLSEAKIIYIAGTTFPQSFIKKLNRKLMEAPLDSIVITLSYTLPEEHFNLYREMYLNFTWGKTHIYFHRRRDKRIKKVGGEQGERKERNIEDGEFRS